MSVAVAHITFLGSLRVQREIVRPLTAWDSHLRSQVQLSTGTLISEFEVVRGSSATEEPYRVEFQVGGRHYSCALYVFLPRTQAVSVCADTERKPAGRAIAV